MTDLSTQTTEATAADADQNGNDEADLTNDKRFNDFIKVARGLGKDEALGADALPKLAIAVVRAAKDKIIDLEANKDAIKQVYGVYWAQRTNKKYSIHAQGKDSQGAQVSKLKQFAVLGANDTFNGEEVFNRAVDLYKERVKTADKIKPVYAAYLDTARMLNDWKPANGNVTPTDEEIEACFYPKEKADKTLEEVIEHIAKQLGMVVSGERKDGISSQDTEITDAVESLQRFLAKMTLAAELNAYRASAAKFAALGLQ
jgi:hypothetical protein